MPAVFASLRTSSSFFFPPSVEILDCPAVRSSQHLMFGPPNLRSPGYRGNLRLFPAGFCFPPNFSFTLSPGVYFEIRCLSFVIQPGFFGFNPFDFLQFLFIACVMRFVASIPFRIFLPFLLVNPFSPSPIAAKVVFYSWSSRSDPLSHLNLFNAPFTAN